MKWKESDFNSGIESIRAVLIYGPDAGQVDEYCDRAVEKLEICSRWIQTNCAKSKMRCLPKVAVHPCSVDEKWL